MTPFEIALEYLGGDIYTNIARLSLVGHVIIEPHRVVLAQAVPRDAKEHDILGQLIRWPEEVCDAWFVHFAAGAVIDVLSAAPHAMPWLGWQRDGGRFRWHSWEAVTRKISPTAPFWGTLSAAHNTAPTIATKDHGEQIQTTKTESALRAPAGACAQGSD